MLSRFPLLWVAALPLVATACGSCDGDLLRRLEDREGDAARVHNERPDPNPDVVPGDSTPLDPPVDPGRYVRQPTPSPIFEENLKPGAPDWRSGRIAWADEVELYTSTESASASDEIRVMASSDVDSTVRAEVFRIGWYGGAGARRVWEGGPFPIGTQPPCERDAVTARVECDWKATFSFKVGADWPSGFYLVKITREKFGFKRWAPFVVRDSRAAEILYTPNFTTYQAYNTFGGESLYSDDSGLMPSGRAWEVSFNRPYRAEEGGGKTFELDLALVQFLERHHYDVTYGSQLDFVRWTHFLDGIGAFVHGGQDEYWPIEERNQIDAALASGQMSLAYFGGNGAYWRVRFLSDSAGTELRTMACYKSEPELDPIPNSTTRFRDEPNALPEHALFGSMYDGWQLIPFPLVVTDPGHWSLAGTGLLGGEVLPGLVGFEFDKAFPEVPGHPAGLEIPMQSPVVTAEGIPSHTTMVSRTLESGRLVFSASTIWWARGLSELSPYRDARVERITFNVLERALDHRRPRRELPPLGSERPVLHPPNPRWVQDVSAFVGAGRSGSADGSPDTAEFFGPTGLAATSTGELVVADTGNNRIRLVRLQDGKRIVETIAGDGRLGYRDGIGADSMFRSPTDVAVDSDGTIYVADSDNHVIRRLVRSAEGTWTVSTVAGKGFSRGFADGPATGARFHRPTAIDLDDAGNIFVADQANNRIRMVGKTSGEVSTLAGTGDAWGWRDAKTGTQAQMNNPSAIAVGPEGVVYFLDGGNQLLRRIEANANRSVTTIAGLPHVSFGFRDGTGAEAQFLAQMGLLVTDEGDVLLADTANFRIRKIVPGPDAATTLVYTIAGSGKIGSRLGNGEVADLVAPTGLALGPNGKIYVSDSHHHVIRELTR